MAVFAGGFGNWVSDKYHRLAKFLSDDSHQGKSPLKIAMENELKAVLESWKNSPPPPNPVPPLTVTTQLYDEALKNVQRKLHNPANLLAKDKVLLEAINTDGGQHELLKVAEQMFTTLNETTKVAGQLATQDLTFMQDTITAIQKTEKEEAEKTGGKYRDPEKTPNLLESMHTQLAEITKQVEALKKKASDAAKSNNPILQQALEVQAHGILRLHGELGTQLNSHLNRELLQASMSKENFKLLHDYLIALEEQQQMLITIAGKNKPRFTPIPVPMLVDADNDRTAAIAKKGDLYGGISFKVKNLETGVWESSVLKSKSTGKVVTGLTRTEILTAIAAAEIRLQKELNDPNYRIKVTEDSDGTIHYDAGNRSNREVLHEAFINAFDNKLDAKAKADAAAEVQYQQGPPKAEVQHVAAADGAAAPAKASGIPSKNKPTDATELPKLKI